MNEPIRIVDTGLHGARWNVAMTAALAELLAARAIPDTLRFHRYERCVLLGRNQDAGSAMDAAYCARAGIEGVHRITGGGAVFMSPHMLAWDVVMDRAAWGSNLASAAQVVCTGIASGLASFAPAARFRAPHDIEIGGRKVSGTAGYAEGRSVILQGTVLIEDECETMARALRIPEAALRASVTCLAEAAGKAPSVALVIGRIASALCGALQRTSAKAELEAREDERRQSLMHDLFGAEALPERIAG